MNRAGREIYSSSLSKHPESFFRNNNNNKLSEVLLFPSLNAVDQACLLSLFVVPLFRPFPIRNLPREPLASLENGRDNIREIPLDSREEGNGRCSLLFRKKPGGHDWKEGSRDSLRATITLDRRSKRDAGNRVILFRRR